MQSENTPKIDQALHTLVIFSFKNKSGKWENGENYVWNIFFLNFNRWSI